MNSEVVSETMYREINDTQNEKSELITTNKNTKDDYCFIYDFIQYCYFCFYICMQI